MGNVALMMIARMATVLMMGPALESVTRTLIVQQHLAASARIIFALTLSVVQMRIVQVGTVMRMENALENVMTTQIALRSLAVNAKTTSAWIPLAAQMMNAQMVNNVQKMAVRIGPGLQD